MTRRVAAVGCLALVLAACGSSTPTTIRAGGDVNGGVIPISQAATYDFTLTGACPSGQRFRLRSDSGATDYLAAGPSSGQLYLSVGNWSGIYVFVGIGNVWTPTSLCPNWHMTLTATG
jgi:hypothetical protein